MSATIPAPADALQDDGRGADHPLARFSPEQLDQIAAEIDAIRDEVMADLGAKDAAYIRGMIRTQRHLEVLARALLLASRRRPAAAAGTAVLTVAKILENVEIGHNVMHGQYDWMNDPAIHSTTWGWDMVGTATSWKRSHNVTHHTYTNVLGLDRDLGYSAVRVEPEQEWHPIYLLQPVYFFLMALVYEWGMALYDMELDAVRDGTKTKEQAREEVKAFARKAAGQVLKDYVVFPALSGRKGFRNALLANLTANVARSVWVHTVTFCGHIPEGAETFTQEQYAGESRGGFYVRQLLGSCNLEGTRAFHIATGQLSYQVEHHLFPDMPSCRYAEVAPRVREVCERHGLPYLSGRLGPQWRSVVRKVFRHALP
jgi:NADPH-dependent stearoyl-CoA 9-desaturase